MWKKIVCLFIILCFIITTTGCGGGLTVPSTQEPSDDFVLIQVKDTESNVSFIAGEKNGDTVTILGEKNSQGDPTKITGTLYISEQGDAIFLEAGIDGLPTYKIDSKGNKITFENYTNSTIDIALYDSNENLIEGPITIDVNPQDLLEIKQLYDSSRLQQKYMPWWGNFIDVQFDWALNVLTFASNNSGIIFDESGNPVDYIKPWEIEVNISDLLPEDNFIIIYEALLPAFIVDDLFDWVSFIWDVIAYIYQDGEDCVPSLLSPSNGAVLDNGCSDQSDFEIWTFDWSDCPGATCYHLYVKQYPNTVYPVIDNDNITSSNYTFKRIAYVAEINRFNWKWKVRAMINEEWGP